MKFLVVMLDSPEHLFAFVNTRLVDRYRLKTPLQGGILFNILAVFRKGCSSYDLNFPAGEGGFHNIGGVHGALCVSRPHNIVYLVDNKNNIACGLDLVEKSQHPGLKLSPELCPRHQSGKIHKVQYLVFQLIRHIAAYYLLRQRLGNGGFAHAGLAYKAGVVFLPAAQYLNNTVKLPLAPHNVVKLSHESLFVDVLAVSGKKLSLLLAVSLSFFVLFFLFVLSSGASLGVCQSLAHDTRQIHGGRVRFVAASLNRSKRAQTQRIVAVFNAVHNVLHFLGHTVHILVAETHLVNNIVDGLDPQLPCALYTNALLL